MDLRSSIGCVSVVLASLCSGCGGSGGSPADGPGARADGGSGGSPTGDPATRADGGSVELTRAYGTIRERRTDGSLSENEARSLVEGNNQLAIDLYGDLIARSPDDNVVIGPYSVSQGMAMVYAGARGKTAEEMRDTLHYELPADRFHDAFGLLDSRIEGRDDQEGVTLSIANQAWGQEGLAFRDPYLDVLTGAYGAPMSLIDFGKPEKARSLINDWVASQTGGEIETLFPRNTITVATKLVVANAIYLEALWEFPFDPERTHPASFHLRDGSTVQVPTMKFGQYLPLAQGDHWSAVELPYQGEDLSMVVIVPDNLRAFERNLTTERLTSILEQITMQGIHLSMPKFAFSFHRSLVPSLKNLGMTTPFTGGADFSAIAKAGLFLGPVEHEAFIEVSEKSTRAGAATGAALLGSHGPYVDVNRPFLFLIRDNPTGTILFMGRVLDPRAD